MSKSNEEKARGVAREVVDEAARHIGAKALEDLIAKALLEAERRGEDRTLAPLLRARVAAAVAAERASAEEMMRACSARTREAAFEECARICDEECRLADGFLARAADPGPVVVARETARGLAARIRALLEDA